MSIDLTKKGEKVAISLAKKGIHKAPVMRVGAALDISPSMDGLYRKRIVQQVFDQLMGIAVTFDDDGSIDTWFFNDRVQEGKTATREDFGTYVRDNAPKVDGGTCYAPVLSAVVDKMTRKSGGFLGFGAKAPKDPALLLFITDGQNAERDVAPAERVIADAQDRNIYFQLIGIGDPKEFGFIRRMGDTYPNCGYVSMANPSMSDDELYELLITDELVGFCRKHA